MRNLYTVHLYITSGNSVVSICIVNLVKKPYKYHYQEKYVNSVIEALVYVIKCI